MELTNEVYDSITRYFRGLSHTGYKSYNEVNKLIVFTFIEELLYGPLSQFVTDKDYTTINNALYCLYGSCMIPYPAYKESFEPISTKLFSQYRHTENNLLRQSESELLRTKS